MKSEKNSYFEDPYYDFLNNNTYIGEDYRLDEVTELIQILNFPENPELPADATELENALFNVRSYLHTVTDNQSCPYTRVIEEQKGYYVYPIFRKVENKFLEYIPNLLISYFKMLEIRSIIDEKERRPSSDKTKYLTTMASFHHSDNLTRSFCQAIDLLRDKVRLNFLQEGLMLSQMHPYHPRESLRPKRSDGILYTSGVPLLMVRKMHKQDHVFMKTEEEMAAYMNHFPLDDESKN